MNSRTGMTVLVVALALFLVPYAAARQGQSSDQPQETSQPDSDMNGMDMGEMHHDAKEAPLAARSANDSMSGMHMDRNPHMYMTELRPANPDDQQRASEILDTLLQSIDKYKDYRVAIGDGYQIYLPNVPQPHFHFTNWRYAYEAEFIFNPARPTSLLYNKTRNGYELEGAMYTAPRRDTEDDLNARVPLSVARWHKHVNLCMPPKGAQWQQINWKQFGFGGAISTEDACDQAGGRWVQQIFNWMVHVYPYEKDPEKIWAH
jgi:hypothetical protein